LTKTKLNKLVESKELYEIKDIIKNYQEFEGSNISKETFKRIESSDPDSISVSSNENEIFSNINNDDETVEAILNSNKIDEPREKRETFDAKIKSNILHRNKNYKKKVKKSLFEPFLACYPVFNGNF
jgi:hypothetical protein